MPKGLVTMSAKEIDRAELIRRVHTKELKQAKAAALMGVSVRQVKRMCRRFKDEGLAGLASRKRGRPSNRKLSLDLKVRVVALVRERYADFGPKLAHEKLVELHGINVGRETVRKWLIEDGVWLNRDARAAQPHQPRQRRQCLGELVQIDGCDHEWFEQRGPRCTLLVYVDDATSRLMELRFAVTESAFDYFAATASYVRRHGRPIAFYIDKHSIFRVAQEGTTGRDHGVTQFGRALAELNVDIICANTPQAKGRVERMNLTLQDRLVKELRLQGISTMEAGNAYLPTFMDDFNRRFAKPPSNPHDAHRAIEGQDLARIFSWREERTMSRNLVVHYKRMSYLVQPTPEVLKLGRRKAKVSVHEWQDGRVESRHGGTALPYLPQDKNPHVRPGDIVENKRLGAVLAAIQVAQGKRDEERLVSPKMTVAQKQRLRAKRKDLFSSATTVAPPKRRGRPPKRPDRITLDGVDSNGPVQAFFDQFAVQQAERRRKYNDAGNERKRAREFDAARTRRSQGA
jgi:transposase